MQNHFSRILFTKKIMSGGNFISVKIKTFCRNLNIEQAFSSSYHHQSNGEVEACIKLTKQTLKKCFVTKSDPHTALLQIRLTLLWPGLPSPATLLFNHPIRGLMLTINRPPTGVLMMNITRH